MQKSKILMLLVSLISLTAYSQSGNKLSEKVKFVKVENDTLIWLNVSQSKFLVKKVYAKKGCDSIVSLCEGQAVLVDSIKKENTEIKEDYKEVVKNNNQQETLYKATIDGLNNKLVDANKQTAKQRTHKVIAIIGGAVLTLFTSYMYITK